MSVISNLENEIKTAMKAKDSNRLNTLRLIKSTVKNKEIELMKELTDADFIQVLSTMVKQRKESIEQYEKGGRAELAQAEKDELVVISSFLPEPLSEEDAKSLIQEAISKTGAEGMKDMGKVMGAIKSQTAGRIDGKILADLVKSSLS